MTNYKFSLHAYERAPGSTSKGLDECKVTGADEVCQV